MRTSLVLTVIGTDRPGSSSSSPIRCSLLAATGKRAG